MFRGYWIFVVSIVSFLWRLRLNSDEICNVVSGEDLTDKEECSPSLHESRHFSGEPAWSQSTPINPQERVRVGLYSSIGILCAFLSLLIVPEIFGSAAIILEAYVWKREQGNRGLVLIVLGVLCMLIGIYFTSYFALIDLIPQPSSSGQTSFYVISGLFHI